jgi:hypothetical protein
MIALGLLFGLVAVEGVLRIARITPERYARPTWAAWYQQGYHATDIWGNIYDATGNVVVPFLVKRQSRFAQQGVLMGEYVPGAIYKCIYATNPRGYFDPDNGVVMTINAWGMRAGIKPVPLKKGPDTYRILMLGDSFTFGIGVRDHETFSEVLHKRLNDASTDGTRYEVLNAGVQGYNTRDEVLAFEHQWMQLDPDLVLITFYLNDAYADSTILNNGEALGIYLKNTGRVARVSYAWDMIQHKRQARKVTEEVERYYKGQFFSKASQVLESPGVGGVDWTVSKAALLRAQTLCRERNIDLGLAIFPELFHLDDSYPFTDIHALVARTCRANGIPVIDLFDTFRGQDESALWAHPSDHHPNEVAHRMAAEAFDDFIRAEFLKEGARKIP